ncbi:hypothetical protein PSEUBRA_006049 [Kalmanozyma brasiliensis GHG001]|uniref:uncharacterized protein n=1 Tax=Kalmanozyma brasiliensis (strain GHG001) TaxID=1365824 RepID=UPI001CE72903|nr:uncharacterized protein PSEUBRA_006049 [Kalmanozyma brasiliensis GHG001]KAF6767607.1 hypothetical protein PSEUBRA_006049 [Kalmanozyma brasiliensis GHG001]
MLALHLLLVALRLTAAAPMDHGHHGLSWEELYHQSWPQLPYSPDSSSEAAQYGQESSSSWSPHAFPPSSPQQWDFDAQVPSPGHQPAGADQDTDVITISDDSAHGAHAHSNDVITISDSASQEPESVSSTESTGRQGVPASMSTADHHSQIAGSSRVRRPASTSSWWEPSSVRAIKTIPPLRQDRRYVQASIGFRSDPALQGQINTRLFGDKMHWVPDDQLALLSNTLLRNMWPLRRASRPVLFVDPPRTPSGDPQIRLYMTQHSRSMGSNALSASTLGQRPHYLFWGVQEGPSGTSVVIYGAGHIETSDHEAVNRHLQPLLDGLKRAV